MTPRPRLRPGAGLAAALLALATAAAAQTPPTPAAAAPLHLTLEQAVAMAASSDPGLAAVAHRAAGAADLATAASRERWGELAGVARYSRFNDDEILRPMSRELLAKGIAGLPFDRNQLHYGLELEVPLYLGGTLSHRIDVARLEQQKVAALAEGTRWQVRFNAVSLYAAASSLDASVTALDELVAALDKTESRLDIAVKAGKRPELDRLKVTEELEGARARRDAVKADRRRVGALLAALLGRDPATPLDLAPLPDAEPGLRMAPEALRALVDDSAPVRQARLAAEQAEHGVRIATGAFLPKVALHANVMEHSAPSVDSPLETWEVSAGVRVPLFAGGARFSRLAAARQGRDAAAKALESARLKALAGLDAALADLDAARPRIASGRARVAAGTEAARIEQIRYDNGAGTVEDLLRARAREEAARADLAQARGALVTAAERVNSIVEKEAVR